MENCAIKAIIFDLGNVVVDFDHALAARRMSGHTRLGPDEIYNLFFDSELTGLFEEGKILPQDFFLKVKAMLGLEISYAEFLPIWNEIFFLSEKNRAVHKLAECLRAKYKTLMLSNVNTLHFEYLKREFPVFNIFDEIVASCEVGMRKPHPDIYLYAINRLGVSPREVFYTDDRADLIEGAKSLSIRGFVFQGIDKLKQDHLSIGVKNAC